MDPASLCSDILEECVTSMENHSGLSLKRILDIGVGCGRGFALVESLFEVNRVIWDGHKSRTYTMVHRQPKLCKEWSKLSLSFDGLG